MKYNETKDRSTIQKNENNKNINRTLQVKRKNEY